jgi:predicted helicase
MRDGIPLGEKHTVFGLAAMVGIAVTFLVKSGQPDRKIFYSEVGFRSTREEKFALLDSAGTYSRIRWKTIVADKKQNWLTESIRADFDDFLPIGDLETKAGSTASAVFGNYSRGAETTRDNWLYNYQPDRLIQNVRVLIETYNEQLSKWQRRTRGAAKLDDFLIYDDKRIKWSSSLKQSIERNISVEFHDERVRASQYRPFTKQYLYFDDRLMHRRGQLPIFFPTPRGGENRAIAVTAHTQIPFLVQQVDCIPCLDVGGRPTQVFPFYTYAEDGTHRRENITDWALEQFRAHYHDPSITKWDIFHYIYAVLHHPEYRERYAANLRRELPRIPFATLTPCHPEEEESSAKQATPNEGPMHLARTTTAADESMDPSGRKERGPQDDSAKVYPVSSVSPVVKDFDLFSQLAKAGQRLAEIHVHYEQQPEYKLTKVEKKGEKLDYRVTKMKLSKDKITLIYNQFLTLSGIPKETYDYRLGNRSALEWVIDQYQVSTDKRSGITNDPNRADDPQYILRLVGQVIGVSLETTRIVQALPPLGFLNKGRGRNALRGPG